MAMNGKLVFNTRRVRELAQCFSAEQLSHCMDDQLCRHSNECAVYGDDIDVVNLLTKASFIRKQVDEGVDLRDAVRELGRRMRDVITSAD